MDIVPVLMTGWLIVSRMAVQAWEKAHNPDILPQEGGREIENASNDPDSQCAAPQERGVSLLQLMQNR